MTKAQYLAKRKELMNNAQQLLNEGKAEEAEAKMKEVTALDEEWDKLAQAQANFNALNNEPQAFNPFQMEDSTGDKGEAENEVEAAWSSEEYKNAWAKTLMGRQLTNDESTKFKMVNEAFTHTTENTGIVIPKNVTRGIWETVAEMYPYFADVSKTYVNGILSMVQEDTSSDSSWYEENTKTEDGKEEFKELTLNGCELSRSITISWKLREMSIDDFVEYIKRKMAKKMGAGAGYGATHGAGKVTGEKPEPKGTVTALKEEVGKPQVVEYDAATGPTFKDILLVRSKIKSGYGARACIYANSTTVWTKLAGILDANKRPLFIPDLTASGVFRILGLVVKEDDSMSDGEILFSNPVDGYHMNINKEMSVMTEEHVKDRKTDYCGYAIMDGDIVTSKAHALLCEKTA